jgi:hypothetical protein
MGCLSEKEIQEGLDEFDRIAKEKVPSAFSNRYSSNRREFDPFRSEEFINDWDPFVSAKLARVQKWRY